MSEDKHLKQLKEAIEYAVSTGSFSKRNIVDNAENVCVFGLGTYFEEAFVQQNVKDRFHVNMICDNNINKALEVVKDSRFSDLECISVEKLKTLTDVVVILMLGDPREVEKQLKDIGITNVMTFEEVSVESIMDLPRDIKWFENSSSKIIDTYNCLSDEESRKVFVNIICNRIAPNYSNCTYDELYCDDQYFNKEIIDISEDECFVDCGAYIGDTIEDFLKRTNNRFEKIFTFELDTDNYNKVKEKVESYDNETRDKIKCFNLGVWNEETEITYGKGAVNDSPGGISIYKSDNKNIARVVKLDDVLLNEKVTFIKMDIEGAEQNALKGAENIIRKQKPKLAICLYHKLDDFWEIPLYLKQILPEYKVGIRHHFRYNFLETVCYLYV